MKTKLINYIIEIIVASILFINWLILFWLSIFNIVDIKIFINMNELFLPLLIGYLGHSVLSSKRKDNEEKEGE